MLLQKSSAAHILRFVGRITSLRGTVEKWVKKQRKRAVRASGIVTQFR